MFSKIIQTIAGNDTKITKKEEKSFTNILKKRQQ